MSGLKGFFAVDNDSSVFKFTIDTTKIVAGATDGSQLSDRFVLPFLNSAGVYVKSFTLKVSDGRPDVFVTTANYATYRTIIFSAPGIYTITLIGSAYGVSFKGTQTPDKSKLISVERLDPSFTLLDQAFWLCANCEFNVPYMVVNNMDRTFNGIKKFGSNVDLSKYYVSKAPMAFLTFSGTLTSVFQGFFLSLTNASQYLKQLTLTGIPKIIIIAPNLTNVTELLAQSNYRGILEIRSNVLSNISYLNRFTTNPPSMGLVDIRNVTTATDFITSAMSTANVNATLTGWVNNFDWSAIPTVANKVTFDFKGSTYNASALSAKTFLEGKGIIFTNLTLV